MTVTATAPPRAAAGATPSAAAGRRRNPVLTLGMLAVLVYFLLPLFWLVVAATKSTGALFSSFGLWFGNDFALAANVRNVFTADGGVYVHWLLNTAMYALVSAGGAALLAALGGYGFAKFAFRGNRLLFGAVLGAIMVPSTALVIPTYLIFSNVGLVNTPWAVILPSLVNPFGLYLMRVYVEEAVPDSILEAARIDGAGEFRIFRQVVLRLLAPGFVTVLLFTLVATWNNYFLPLIMLNNPSLYPVTVGLANWAARASVGGGGTGDVIPLVVTGSLLSIIPLVAAFLMLQRYWQNGLTAGGVKQ
ncbi:carbohydrate ABC transporter permease [Nonomuraea angiospora]|uniref:carbohydrate ABC transporter permease n=1 Tax=Nonomuraea angiospora TaxID=46172 RepID=UPI0034283C4C